MQGIEDCEQIMKHNGGRNEREKTKRPRDPKNWQKNGSPPEPRLHVFGTCHVLSELCNFVYSTHQENEQNRVDLKHTYIRSNIRLILFCYTIISPRIHLCTGKSIFSTSSKRRKYDILQSKLLEAYGKECSRIS